MTATETIPLPTDRIRDRLPFDVRVTDLTAWPDQELHLRFEYNDLMERWLFKLTHHRGGTLVPKSVATLERRYSAWPYLLVQFRDTGGEHTQITHRNLGTDIVLAVYPGPAGGSYLPEADISQAREDQLLNRHEYYPHRGRRTNIQVPAEVTADDGGSQ